MIKDPRARRGELEREQVALRAEVPKLKQAVRRLEVVEERLTSIAYDLAQVGG